jgi:hypothetical protein
MLHYGQAFSAKFEKNILLQAISSVKPPATPASGGAWTRLLLTRKPCISQIGKRR